MRNPGTEELKRGLVTPPGRLPLCGPAPRGEVPSLRPDSASDFFRTP